GADDDAAALGRELERVGHVVVEDLAQLCGIDGRAAELIAELELEVDAAIVGDAAQDVADLDDDAGEVDRLGGDHEGAGLDLGEVEDVVDQAEQVARAAQDVAEE